MQEKLLHLIQKILKISGMIYELFRILKSCRTMVTAKVIDVSNMSKMTSFSWRFVLLLATILISQGGELTFFLLKVAKKPNPSEEVKQQKFSLGMYRLQPLFLQEYHHHYLSFVKFDTLLSWWVFWPCVVLYVQWAAPVINWMQRCLQLSL